MKIALLLLIAFAAAAADTFGVAGDLRSLEGLSLQPYADAGGWSVGYGHWSATKPAAVSEATAETLLLADIATAEAAARKVVPAFATRSPAAQRVLVQLAFQLGESGLRKFRGMLGSIAAGDYNAASAHLLDSRLAKQCPTRTAGLAAALAR